MRKFLNLIELDVSSMIRTILTVAITFLTYVLFKNVIATVIVGFVVLWLINTLGLAKKFRYGASILAIIIMSLACIFTHATLNNITKDDHVCEPEVITINTCKCTCEGCVNGGECLCMNKDKEDDNKTESGEGNGKVTQNRNYGKNNGSGDKMKPTYHNTEGDNNNGGGTTVIKGGDNTDFGDTTNNDQNEKVEKQLEEEGKEVVAESDNGIKAWADTTEDDKKDDNKNDKKDETPVSKTELDKAEELPKPSKKEDTDTKPVTPSKPSVMSEDEIESLSPSKPGNGAVSNNGTQNTNTNSLTEETKKEEDTSNKGETTNNKVEVKPETPKTEEKQPVKEEVKPNTDKGEVETPKPVEETKPVVTKKPVSITPLDGNSAFAGDTVQFRVSGDIKSVEGMDGVNYTLGSGVLSVQTNNNEATVLSPTLVGEDGSTASATVTVNALNFNN